jgi:hypothetical protein
VYNVPLKASGREVWAVESIHQSVHISIFGKSDLYQRTGTVNIYISLVHVIVWGFDGFHADDTVGDVINIPNIKDAVERPATALTRNSTIKVHLDIVRSKAVK